ncbi:BrnT family toxin [Devosia alba]|uniref:BrnT family toxin n=1 Tax=Devosia alba TaxID=3152360 RepID=UPI003267C47C
MEYEWDENKRQTNIDKHRVDFRIAAFIFEGPVLKIPDTRRDYGEQRYLSIGLVEDEYFVVVHTERDNVVRLISAWKGGRRDRRKYQAVHIGRPSSHEG